ncbi:MAG: hypothetical protein BWX66_02155 [Deltaproteobacteria bacterium ADurb.Bin058]|nr:MAG: hypothetical protein BWX66_02155 [Deltaproteobacteria bacterium ADurb.Bin058]
MAFKEYLLVPFSDFISLSASSSSCTSACSAGISVSGLIGILEKLECLTITMSHSLAAARARVRLMFSPLKSVSLKARILAPG